MQVPLAASQMSVAPMQALVLLAEHWAQAPLAWQAGVAPPQSPSTAQAWQTCALTSHTGVTPLHCAFETQATQVPGATSHAGVVPLHRLPFVAEHWAQPPLGWQAGVAPPQSPSTAQARHVYVPASQTGDVPPHWAPDRQATQVPLPVLHSGVVPEHRVLFVAEQTPQVPEGWQAGVAPPQSLSLAQPRQSWNAGSQIGAAAGQSALARHVTQAPTVV